MPNVIIMHRQGPEYSRIMKKLRVSSDVVEKTATPEQVSWTMNVMRPGKIIYRLNPRTFIFCFSRFGKNFPELFCWQAPHVKAHRVSMIVGIQ